MKVVGILLLLVAVTFSCWTVYNDHTGCISAEACMTMGREEMKHFQTLSRNEETPDEKAVSLAHAQKAVSYFERAKDLGGDPGWELENARDTVLALEPKTVGQKQIDRYDKFWNKVSDLTNKASQK